MQTVYTGMKNLTLTVGISNLFDEIRRTRNAGGQVYFQGGYDPGYADPRGRFIYGRVNYEFF